MLRSKLFAYLTCAIPSVLFGAISLAPTDAMAACVGAPTTTQTKCLTAVQIPNNPLRSFDISWVNPKRAEMYFADRSNNAIEVIDTETLTWKRRLAGFVGVVLNSAGGRQQQRVGTGRRREPRPLALRGRRQQHPQGV